ncbi:MULTISPECIES: hypothetical protein [unclassified Duganella]|uniref:hypothetical protein n=1 Tax=unclassified Duganella TaxID=2636909 RepID=UPI000B872D8D|nr:MULTISPECIES: hypothetical protein [unclassified Duganella]
MKIVTGKIVAGQVVVEDMPFDEGATVTVFSRDGSESFELTPEQEAEMQLSLEEADRGDLVPAADLLKSLRSQS